MGWQKGFKMPGAPAPEREVDEEIEFHLRMRTEELEGTGMSRNEAREQAEREFGDLEGTQRYCRKEDRRRRGKRRRLGLALSLRDELVLVLRTLGRRPASVVAPVAILTLAIALNALVLSVVRGVLLTPLPFQDPDRVVVLEEQAEGGGLSRAAYPVLEGWRRDSRSVEAMGAYLEHEAPFMTENGAVKLGGALVTRGFFRLLKDPILRGRAFTQDEHAVGARRVALVSQGFWEGTLGADPGVLEQSLTLHGERWQVVGVVRDEAVYPEGAELWLPVEAAFPDVMEIAGAKIFTVLARLRPGTEPGQAGAEMGRISAGIDGGAPEARAIRLRERLLGDVRTPLLLLEAAVLLVLLAAAVNAGGLLLARGVRRRGEVALRASLGAGAGRVAGGLLLEGLVLGGTAGIAGVLLAAGTLGPVLTLVPGNLPRVDQVALDGWVVLTAVGLALGTGLVTSLVSAIASARTSPATLLRESSPSAGSSPWLQRTLESLVVVQVGLAVVLNAGSGLLLRSFVATVTEDPGFRAQGVTLVDVSLPETGYPDGPSRVAFARELIDRAQTLPGAQEVALGRNLPISNSNMTSPLRVEGSGEFTEAVQIAAVTEGYFDVMGIPFVDGGGFGDADRVGGPAYLIVDTEIRTAEGEALGVGDRAHSFFGDQDYREIRGVVGAVRHRSLRASPVPIAYEPFFQKEGQAGFTLLVRSTAPAGTVAQAARNLLRELDPGIPVGQIGTMESRISRSVAEPRFYTVALSIFGALAILLSLAGCQAGLAHRVASRRRELGIRIALGASVPSVRAMILKRGLTLTTAGIVLGILAAIPGTRLLESQLYGVSAFDPLTYGALLILLLGAGALASDLPARRAATTDPANVLKEG